MANTFIQIGSTVTVGVSGAATIDFSSIPATYTDLILKISSRSTFGATYYDTDISFNGSAASMTRRALYADGTNPASFSAANSRFTWAAAPTATASNFSNAEIYIPNYAGSANKSVSSDTVVETNAASGNLLAFVAGLWSNTAAINQITLTPTSGTFVQYSTASLYGIKKN
jgi:hypothetical protein